MYEKTYWQINNMLDEVLGADDGGDGLASDVALLVHRYKLALKLIDERWPDAAAVIRSARVPA